MPLLRKQEDMSYRYVLQIKNPQTDRWVNIDVTNDLLLMMIGISNGNHVMNPEKYSYRLIKRTGETEELISEVNRV